MENFKIIESIQKIEKRQNELLDSINNLMSENNRLREQLQLVNGEISPLKERLAASERMVGALRELLLSAKPIKSVYNKVGIGTWVRVYHTDLNFLDNHNRAHKSYYTDEMIGFALTKNPGDVL